MIKIIVVLFAKKNSLMNIKKVVHVLTIITFLEL